MSEATQKFKELFCSETEDQLALLSRLLLSIEQQPGTTEQYATLMRSAHTIKGSSATMGYPEMATLAHALEDLFHAGERGVILIGTNEVSAALLALDLLNASLTSIKAHDTELPTARAVETVLAALAQAGPKTAVNSIAMADDHSSAISPQLAETVYSVPSSVRVDIARLDSLMGLFEEMLMLRLKLDTILEPALGVVKTITDPALKQKVFFINEFKTLFAQMARLLSETQSDLLEMRLVPLDQLFAQFPRMVRDLSLRQKKKITFNIEGGDVELDRAVLDGLGGAIAHLLRNAIDHGITSEGTVALSAERANERVRVIVEDSGSGIDYERVKAIAIERGIIGMEEASRMRPADIIELLFHQNISTSEQITDISGRGVGLSAVKAFAQEVGGRVSVISPINEGGGTQFVLDLPVSLATVNVLLVTTSGFTFAIPFVNIVRTVAFSKKEIVPSAHQETVVIDGRPLPLVRLNRLLGITFAEMFHPHRAAENEDLLAVLITVGDERILLLVDECVGEQELLVKSLPPLLRDVKGFSGSTLLPDGRTILLLDAHGLLLQAFGDILENTSAS